MATDLVTVRGSEYHGVFVVQVPSTEFWIHAYMERNLLIWRGIFYADIQRKQLMRLIDDALTIANEEMSEVVLAWRRVLVQDGLVSIRKRLAAKAIQRSFREANINPAYLLCKKRLMRESTELVL